MRLAASRKSLEVEWKDEGDGNDLVNLEPISVSPRRGLTHVGNVSAPAFVLERTDLLEEDTSHLLA